MLHVTFTVVDKKWKQFKYSSTEKGIIYIYIDMMKHDSISKKVEIFTIYQTWKNPGSTVLSEMSQTQKKKLYNFIYTEKIKCGYEQDYMGQKIKGQ